MDASTCDTPPTIVLTDDGVTSLPLFRQAAYRGRIARGDLDANWHLFRTCVQAAVWAALLVSVVSIIVVIIIAAYTEVPVRRERPAGWRSRRDVP